MANNKLVGQNYTTPDLVAKVTGRAKFAEDFRAEGMLFAKQLLSPMPHARVTRIDASAALAMPGVKAMLTADDLPKPAGGMTDLGQKIEVDPHNERALTMEPMYRGRADSRRRRGRRTDRRRSDRADRHRIRAAAVRRRSARQPAAGRPQRTHRRQRLDARSRATSTAGPFAPLIVGELKWTEADFAGRRRGAAADGQAGRPSGRTATSTPGSRTPALVLDETFVTPNVSHQTLEPRTAMAYWQNGKLFMHCSTQSTVQTVAAVAALGGHRRRTTSSSSASTPAAASAARSPATSRSRFRRCSRRRRTRR